MVDNVGWMNVAAWEMAALLTVGLLLCISAALWLREKSLFDFRGIAALRRRPLAEIALVAVIVGGFVHHGATKTNGNARCGCESLSPSAARGGTRSPGRSGGGLSFAWIEPQTNGVALAIALPPDGVTGNTLDIFCTTNLLSPWSLIGVVTVASVAATADVFVAVSDLPVSPTNMPQAAFFNAGTHDDTDGDGLYDGRERIVFLTDPLRPDTDGDGIFDGAEVAIATSPLLRDSDGDGYPDDEEIAASMDPLVAHPGASGTVRYVYDEDDRLAATYIGSDGGASLTGWSPTGNAASVAERMAR